MNLRDIEYTLKAYETGRFAEAAKQCHISQPSLSIQIKKIEQELGHAIFVRQQNGVKLTDFGNHILPYFEDIQRNVGLIKNYAQNHANQRNPRIRLGAIFTVAPFLFPHIQSINNLRFEESNTKELLAKLLNEKLDAAIMALPVKTPVLITKKILREPFYLTAKKNNTLAKKIKLKTLTFPKECQFVALTEEHCLGDQIKDICHLFGYRNKKIIEKTSLETIRRLIAASDYFTLMPEMAKSKNDGLQYKKLPEKYYREIGLVYRKHAPLEDHILKLWKSIKTKLNT